MWSPSSLSTLLNKLPDCALSIASIRPQGLTREKVKPFARENCAEPGKKRADAGAARQDALLGCGSKAQCPATLPGRWQQEAIPWQPGLGPGAGAPLPLTSLQRKLFLASGDCGLPIWTPRLGHQRLLTSPGTASSR